MHKWFGSVETFAVEYIGEDSGLVQANVFASGQNITPVDNMHYDQFFVHGAMAVTARRLLELSERWHHSNLLRKDGLLPFFLELWHEGSWSDYSVLDWPPCTSQFRCAIIPCASQFYLCCARHDLPEKMYASAVCLERIAADLQAAREHIVANTASPFLKLEFK